MFKFGNDNCQDFNLKNYFIGGRMTEIIIVFLYLKVNIVYIFIKSIALRSLISEIVVRYLFIPFNWKFSKEN